MSRPKFKALPLLVAALTVCENFSANSEALIAEQSQWADPYIADFKKLIENFLAKYFGISSKKDLKDATRVVETVRKKAYEDLSIIKAEIVRNYNGQTSRKEAVLERLGYKTYWDKVRQHSQSDTISLLFSFFNNLTPELRAELEGKNINKARMDNIISLKQTLSDANITQEKLKGSSKLDTAETQAALNEIYDKAISICDIAKRLFHNDPQRKDLFVFSKLVKAQESAGQATPSKAKVATPAK
jgi:hypothetical protein